MNNYKLRVTQTTANTETNVRVTANKEGFFPTSKILGVSDKVPIVMEYVKYEGDATGYDSEVLKGYTDLKFYVYVEDRIATKLKDYSTNKEDYVSVSYSDTAIKWVYNDNNNKADLGYVTLNVYESYVNEQLLPKTKMINGVNCTCLSFTVGMVCPEFTYGEEHPTQLTLTLKDPENISKSNSITLNVTVVGTGKLIDSPPTAGVTNEQLIYTISADQYGWTYKTGVWNVPSDWYNNYVDIPVKCVMSNKAGASYTWYGWSCPYINKDPNKPISDTGSWRVINTHRPANIIGRNYYLVFADSKNTGFRFDLENRGQCYVKCFSDDGSLYPSFNYVRSYTPYELAYADGFSMKVYKLTY